MCDVCYNFSKSVNTDYNDFLKEIEANFDFESIGKEYEINEEVDLSFFNSIPLHQEKFRVVNLYKYEPQPGYSPIQSNSRRFCRQLYLRTSNQNNYLTFSEVQSLSNPGSKYGVNDILRYCGNFTTDLDYTSCRHRWIRFKFDNETGNIARDTSQPLFAPSTAAK